MNKEIRIKGGLTFRYNDPEYPEYFEVTNDDGEIIVQGHGRINFSEYRDRIIIRCIECGGPTTYFNLEGY